MLLNSNLTPSGTQKCIKLPRIENLDIASELAVFRRNNKAYYEAQNQKSRINEIYQDIGNSDFTSKTIEGPYPDQSYTLEVSPICIHPEFKLILSKSPALPLCKGKYFTFKVILQSMTQISYPVNERLELEVLVFSQDDNLITKNMKGKDILRGNYIQSMNFFSLEQIHVAYFRIQLTEVSSHYVGKSLKLKIQARKSDFLRATGWKVQSTFISNVKVKAKNLATSANS